MNKNDLQFDFPESLIAQEPLRPSRICSALQSTEKNFPYDSEKSYQKMKPEKSSEERGEGALDTEAEEVARELSWDEFLSQFQEGDVLVLNNTKVLKRRVFSVDGVEILFLSTGDQIYWNVLFPSRRYKVGSVLSLPGEIEVTLLEKGRPQKVKSNQKLYENYFTQYGELPLPPYIQKARAERHTQAADERWYQTQWSEKPGSFAAPTASLHFTQEHLSQLKGRGVIIAYLTLHVGLGTFLPVEVEDLNQHIMHKEWVEIPQAVIQALETAQQKQKNVWAMGTTVVRALESYGCGLLSFDSENSTFVGHTDLLILPGFQFKMVHRMLTNFHQPESTLLALVMAFAGIEKVKKVYQWAIANKFRLFSYGDLSVWKRST